MYICDLNAVSKISESASRRESLYTKEFSEAAKHTHAREFMKCVATARYYQADPIPPRFFRSENVSLVPTADIDRYAIERCGLEIERRSYIAHHLTKAKTTNRRR